MSETVKYFAYGANRDAKMIAAITGVSETELVGRPAVLEGYKLGVQGLDQIPDTLVPNAPYPESPRKILRDGWGDGFESYVIVKSEGDKVSGTVWELTPLQRERVRDWELLDFGWYRDDNGVAKLADGTEIPVVTESVDAERGLLREVDGLNYETWLADPERFVEIATAARLEFDGRLADSAKDSHEPNPEISGS